MKPFDLKNLNIQVSDIYNNRWLEKNISLSLLRLDLIDTVISGNKLFKLYYFLQKAILSNKKIITFGGAYSNHLAAAAAICKNFDVQSIAIVRGERPSALSTTLLYCVEQGMQLEFVSRGAYKEKENKHFLEELHSKFGAHILIPGGGFGYDGVKGAAAIYEYIGEFYTHICCAVGTGTTIAGLITAAHQAQQIIGFSALKNFDFEERILHLADNPIFKNYHFIHDYHFGGYAKKTNELINFINTFYDKYMIPLDFVYTGKMMYGIFDLISKNYFAEGSKIICIHSGGLQGNSSLHPGVLNF